MIVYKAGQYYYSTTYAWLENLNLNIPKDGRVTLHLLADIPANEPLNQIIALIPGWTPPGDPDWIFSRGIDSHIMAVGLSSNKHPNYQGDGVFGNMMYLAPFGKG